MARDRTAQGVVRPPPPVGGSGGRDEVDRTSLVGTMDQEAFLGVLSHELRTPVTTIYGGAQLLATRELSDSRRRALASDVGQEAERLYRIVEDLVVLLRSERGELRSAGEPVAIGRLIAGAIERELERNPGLKIRYLGASDAATDQADELLIAHTVRNLLDNAIRNANARGPIEIVVEIEGEEVVVRVLDRGSERVEPTPGDRIDSVGTPAGRAGGGLGLFVAARLVQAMNGRSWARSRPGGGAEFGFALRRSLDGPRPISA